MTTIGPHLLGRVPSTPDERDYKLSWFLGDPDPILVALKVLQASHSVAAATKAWAAIATTRIVGASPAPGPAPAPAPSPQPAPGGSWADTDPVLDQGDYGTCVGNGWADWGNSLPVDDHFTEVDARAIYYEATVIDGQPDNPDQPGGGQQGSSVRSGAQAMQNRKRLAAYAFADTLDDVKAWLDTKGPVVFGTDWTADMFNPDTAGFITPTGTNEGGHCYLAIADLPDEGAIEFLNSWGDGWGLQGRFKMKYADVATLLQGDGEACAAVELVAA